MSSWSLTYEREEDRRTLTYINIFFGIMIILGIVVFLFFSMLIGIVITASSGLVRFGLIRCMLSDAPIQGVALTVPLKNEPVPTDAKFAYPQQGYPNPYYSVASSPSLQNSTHVGPGEPTSVESQV